MNLRVGDDVRVASGPFEGKRGRVVKLAGPDTVLFESAPQPIYGMLNEDMALLEYRDVNAVDGSGTTQVAVPVRRLETR